MTTQALTLPTVPQQAKKIWRNQKFLMIGAPGIGKSEFWAQGDKTLFIDTEGNVEHLNIMSMKCRSWEDFIEIGSLLIQSSNTDKFPYDTIVIDTLDKWADYASEEIIDRAKVKYAKALSSGLEINTIGDIPEGNGWFGWKGLINNYLEKLAKLPCAIVLIGHTQTKRIEDTVKKYDKNTINIGGQLGVLLLGWANHIMNVEANYSGTKINRIVYSRPSQSREAKSHGATIPDQWTWTDDMKSNFGKLKTLFTD